MHIKCVIMGETHQREHLFINYATEDSALAEWLTLKLTSEGYRVWCARFKLLGGESYPKDIDNAIKNETFRFISLLSHSSIKKNNPLKERTIAQSISQERNEDFIIPINVDGLKPTELDWMTSDLTYIDFSKSWAQGIKQLLKKLESINAPKILKNGREIVVDTYLHSDLIEQLEETVYTNCFSVEKIPDIIKVFRIESTTTPSALKNLSYSWDLYQVDTKTVFSFHDPPDIIKNNFSIKLICEEKWKNNDNINGIPIENIVKNLLLKSLYMKCLQKGLVKEEGIVYFPEDHPMGTKIHFTGVKGKKTYITTTSRRKRKDESYYIYYLAPVFRIRKNDEGQYIVLISIYLHLTDVNGNHLPRRSAVSCRKQVRGNWWNDDLINRILGIISFLAENQNKIIIGNTLKEQIEISASPISLISPLSINEENAPKETAKESIFDLTYEEDDESIEELDNEITVSEKDDVISGNNT